MLYLISTDGYKESLLSDKEYKPYVCYSYHAIKIIISTWILENFGWKLSTCAVRGNAVQFEYIDIDGEKETATYQLIELAKVETFINI